MMPRCFLSRVSRLTRLTRVAAPLVMAAACSSTNGGAPAEEGRAPPPAATCQEGFTRDAATGACIEIVAESECPAGTMPEIGKTDCQPVGWTTACPEGFVKAPSGWGCVDRFPSPAPTCAGATREDVKTGTCVPIGDCNAAFPPAGATLFVDDDGVEDATHFRTLKQAMAVAVKNSVVAVEAGTYSEFLELLAENVKVVGRCAEKVVFKTPTPGGARAGVFVPGPASATLRGVTVTGFRGGVLAEGGNLVLEDTLIDGNDTLGVYAHVGATVTMRRSKIAHTTPGPNLGSAIIVYDGSVMTMEDSAVVDNYFRQATVDSKDANGTGVSTLIATRTIFARNTKLSGGEGAISVVNGGLVRLFRSAIVDSLGQGINVDGAGSRAELTESVVRRTRGELAKDGGVGVIALEKGVAKLTSSAVTDHPVLGVYAGRGGGVVMVDKSVIAGVPPEQKVEFGRGASGSQTGHLDMTDSAVVGCPQSGIGLQVKASGTFDHIYVKGSRPYLVAAANGGMQDYGGFGLLVEDGSTATIKRSSFEGNTLAGLTSSANADVTAEAVLVRGTRELPGLSAGSGVQVGKGGKMTMARCALSGNVIESAIVALDGSLSMTGSTLHGTVQAGDGLFGHGLAVFGKAHVELVDTSIYGNPGVGLISDGGQASVRGGTFAKNAVALHAQNGASITQSDDAEALAAGEVRVSPSTRFVDNQTRVGNGVLALPPPPIQ